MDFIKKIGYPMLFWLLFLAFMVTSARFGAPPNFDKGAIGETGHSVMATLVFCLLHYTNMFLLQNFFEKGRLHAYWMGVIATLGCFSLFLYFFVFQFLLRQDIPYFVALVNMVFPMLISTAYYFVRKGFTTQIELNEAQSKQLEAEMQLLKMQIQPHFLFNTLNNIYATNLENHKDANEMIMQLSEILRFQLESHKKEFIKLTEEIEIIHNYVALEKVRLHDCKVTVTQNGDFEGFSILSLLLLPLIENAFKYGKNNINIVLTMQEKTFVFECENEIINNIQYKQSNKIGLQNVQKRLELMYPERYSFSAQANDNVFKVVLKIEV